MIEQTFSLAPRERSTPKISGVVTEETLSKTNPVVVDVEGQHDINPANNVAFTLPGIYKPADVNNDGTVDFADFLLVSHNFGKAEVQSKDGDIDGDGSVGFMDFLLIAKHYSME